MSLPAGFGHIPGRSTAKAVRLLAIAADLDLAPNVIRGVTGGYDVPVEVLDVYQEEGGVDEASVTPTTGDQSFQRIETNHEPLGFDTMHRDESGRDDVTVATSAEQTGVGIERSLAEGERTDDLPVRRTTADKHELAGEGAPDVDPVGSTSNAGQDDLAESQRIKEAADAQRLADETEAAEKKAEEDRRAALTDDERKAEDDAAAAAEAKKAEEAEAAKPAGNASHDKWIAWATEFKSYDVSEDLSRDELRDRYTA